MAAITNQTLSTIAVLLTTAFDTFDNDFAKRAAHFRIENFTETRRNTISARVGHYQGLHYNHQLTVMMCSLGKITFLLEILGELEYPVKLYTEEIPSAKCLNATSAAMLVDELYDSLV